MRFIHPTAVIYDGVSLGEDVWIGPYAVIGSPGERRLPVGDGAGQVRIGDRTVIREFVAIQGPAVVGADCHLMDKTHVAHDCILGNFVTMAPGVVLAGHVFIGDKATLGINTSVHQKLTIGEGAMIGMGSVITRNIPAWEKWYGNPARSHGMNEVGLDRWGTKPPRAVAEMTDRELWDEMYGLDRLAVGSSANV
jgi:UDP-N-acetylglucosamine acyltransferase